MTKEIKKGYYKFTPNTTETNIFKSKEEIPAEWLTKADEILHSDKKSDIEKKKLDKFIVKYYGKLTMEEIHNITGWSVYVVWGRIQILKKEGKL